MDKFWKFKKVTNMTENETEVTENILVLNGPISEQSWYGDEITPQLFKNELSQYSGDITVLLNSPGGDVFAASEIYTALKEYKGKITVKIDGIAASAASVIAMSGDMIEMSPTSMMMVHNPSMMLYGQASELEQGIEFLNEVKEAIINAYALKTGLSRAKLAKLMDAESWMNARSALDYGFCDKIMYTDDKTQEEIQDSFIFDKTVMVTNTISAMRKKLKAISPPNKTETGEKIEQYEKRLELLRR